VDNSIPKLAEELRYKAPQNLNRNQLGCIFHQNMVIWRHLHFWNGFGFFGQGLSGKTSMSFDFALRLFRDGVDDMKIFDDNFLLENGVLRRHEDWGSDRLGKMAAFEQEVKAKDKQLRDFKPIDQEVYRVKDATIWFLSAKDGLTNYSKNPCRFDEFLKLLAENNPCHNPDWKPTESNLMPSFSENWTYEHIWLPTPIPKVVERDAYESYQTRFLSH
jgi:hypothetical protein